MKLLATGLILICLGLVGCGQKGPLYLPQPETPNESVAPNAHGS